MRALRIGLGGGLALAVLAVLWYTGLLEPPEGLRRRAAIFSSVYPGPVGLATIDRIPCPPLRHLALYVVCTERCEGVWRIVAMRGLQAETLADQNRLPRETRSETRMRFSRLVQAEGLHVDAAGARELAGCLMRLDGMALDRLVDDADLERIDDARRDERALENLAETLRDPNGLARVTVSEEGEGFEARVLYWNLQREGWPVQEIRLGFGRDGRILWLKRRELPIKDDTASDSTPSTPPT